MALKTNFTDDILAESMNGKRQYNVTENSNGTKSLEDVTDYQSVGSTFSAKNMNETNAAVNQAYDDMGDEFNKNTKYLAGAVKIHNNKLWKFKVDHDPGEWDESQVRKTTLLDEIGELNEKYIDKTWSFDLSVDAGAAYNTPKNITVDRYAPYAINTFALNSERIIISRITFNGNNLSLLLGNTSPVKVNFNLTVNVRYKKI